MSDDLAVGSADEAERVTPEGEGLEAQSAEFKGETETQNPTPEGGDVAAKEADPKPQDQAALKAQQDAQAAKIASDLKAGQALRDEQGTQAQEAAKPFNPFDFSSYRVGERLNSAVLTVTGQGENEAVINANTAKSAFVETQKFANNTQIALDEASRAGSSEERQKYLNIASGNLKLTNQATTALVGANSTRDSLNNERGAAVANNLVVGSDVGNMLGSIAATVVGARAGGDKGAAAFSIAYAGASNSLSNTIGQGLAKLTTGEYANEKELGDRANQRTTSALVNSAIILGIPAAAKALPALAGASLPAVPAAVSLGFQKAVNTGVVNPLSGALSAMGAAGGAALSKLPNFMQPATQFMANVTGRSAVETAIEKPINDGMGQQTDLGATFAWNMASNVGFAGVPHLPKVGEQLASAKNAAGEALQNATRAPREALGTLGAKFGDALGSAANHVGKGLGNLGNQVGRALDAENPLTRLADNLQGQFNSTADNINNFLGLNRPQGPNGGLQPVAVGVNTNGVPTPANTNLSPSHMESSGTPQGSGGTATAPQSGNKLLDAGKQVAGFIWDTPSNVIKGAWELPGKIGRATRGAEIKAQIAAAKLNPVVSVVADAASMPKISLPTKLGETFELPGLTGSYTTLVDGVEKEIPLLGRALSRETQTVGEAIGNPRQVDITTVELPLRDRSGVIVLKDGQPQYDVYKVSEGRFVGNIPPYLDGTGQIRAPGLKPVSQSEAIEAISQGMDPAIVAAQVRPAIDNHFQTTHEIIRKYDLAQNPIRVDVTDPVAGSTENIIVLGLNPRTQRIEFDTLFASEFDTYKSQLKPHEIELFKLVMDSHRATGSAIVQNPVTRGVVPSRHPSSIDPQTLKGELHGEKVDYLRLRSMPDASRVSYEEQLKYANWHDYRRQLVEGKISIPNELGPRLSLDGATTPPPLLGAMHAGGRGDAGKSGLWSPFTESYAWKPEEKRTIIGHLFASESEKAMVGNLSRHALDTFARQASAFSLVGVGVGIASFVSNQNAQTQKLKLEEKKIATDARNSTLNTVFMEPNKEFASQQRGLRVLAEVAKEGGKLDEALVHAKNMKANADLMELMSLSGIYGSGGTDVITAALLALPVEQKQMLIKGIHPNGNTQNTVDNTTSPELGLMEYIKNYKSIEESERHKTPLDPNKFNIRTQILKAYGETEVFKFTEGEIAENTKKFGRNWREHPLAYVAAPRSPAPWVGEARKEANEYYKELLALKAGK